MYNGWALFVALIYSFAVLPTLLEKLRAIRSTAPRIAASGVGIISSAYLVLCGGILLTDWSNPFKGQEVALGSAIHNPKGWLIVGAIIVWPYLLILVGLVIGYIAARELRWAIRSSN
ncbi:hypothetical protein [Mesorhizobium sp. 131-3-5]|uniref:hypothetical protein n=1 Tax=Mesorhizobium sp. 131-3-5 TaxID=2744520 RepID=UPI001FD0B47A|nr:hypothetical protein [Mesorhizobium sp. 131-3-5]